MFSDEMLELFSKEMNVQIPPLMQKYDTDKIFSKITSGTQTNSEDVSAQSKQTVTNPYAFSSVLLGNIILVQTLN